MFATAAVGASLSVTVDDAVAFPNDVQESCYWFNDTHFFSFFGTWPSAAQTAVRNGVLDWNGSLDYHGLPLVTLQEGDVGYATLIVREDLPDGVLGNANCISNIIRVDTDSGHQSNALQEFIGRHEMGHILGLHHTGGSDSHNGDNAPTMASCLEITDFESTIKSQDDIGSLTFSHSKIRGAPMMANFGLEQGFSYFGKTGGTVDYLTSDGATGPGHVRFAPSNAGSDYVYQTMAWADAPGKEAIAVINHKTNALGDDGTVRVELWARSVTYGTSPPSGCSLAIWPNGKNMNDRTVGEFSLRRTASAGESPVWTLHQTSSWTSLSGGEQDVQIRAFADVDTAGGAQTSVRLDNLRVQCLASQTEGDCL